MARVRRRVQNSRNRLAERGSPRRLALELAKHYNRQHGSWYFQDSLDSYKAAFSFREVEELLGESEFKNYRHIEPVIANFFQVIIISPIRRENVKKVHYRLPLKQKIALAFIEAGFAGRI